MESLADYLRLEDAAPTAPVEAPATDLFSGITTIKEFAERVLNSADYRASLLRRIQLDELPAQIEALLYYYACGKPTERIEHSGKDGGPLEVVTQVRRVVVAVDNSLYQEEQDALETRH